MKCLGPLALALVFFAGCDSSNPSLSSNPPSLNTLATTQPEWHLGDCYKDTIRAQVAIDPDEKINPPWEKALQPAVLPPHDRVFWHMLVAEWELIDGGNSSVFWQQAYFTDDDRAWFTADGALWTETPSSMEHRIKEPCPQRNMSQLRAYGISVENLVGSE